MAGNHNSAPDLTAAVRCGSLHPVCSEEYAWDNCMPCVSPVVLQGAASGFDACARGLLGESGRAGRVNAAVGVMQVQTHGHTRTHTRSLHAGCTQPLRGLLQPRCVST